MKPNSVLPTWSAVQHCLGGEARGTDPDRAPARPVYRRLTGAER